MPSKQDKIIAEAKTLYDSGCYTAYLNGNEVDLSNLILNKYTIEIDDINHKILLFSKDNINVNNNVQINTNEQNTNTESFDNQEKLKNEALVLYKNCEYEAYLHNEKVPLENFELDMYEISIDYDSKSIYLK